jgi:DNA repair ATPase RecN
MTWEQRQQMQKAIEGQQQLRETIDQVTDQLQQGAEKLSQSRALNAELVQ